MEAIKRKENAEISVEIIMKYAIEGGVAVLYQDLDTHELMARADFPSVELAAEFYDKIVKGWAV